MARGRGWGEITGCAEGGNGQVMRIGDPYISTGVGSEFENLVLRFAAIYFDFGLSRIISAVRYMRAT